MKTNLALFTFVALILLGCGKKEELPYIPEKAGYVGTITVMYQGAPFDNEGIEGEELAFSLNFGDYPTSFKGVTTR